MKTFPSKHPSETFAVSFDFSALTATIDSAVVVATIHAGTDTTPASVLSGAATAATATATQRVISGESGNDYLLTCTAVAGANTWVLEAVLPVRTLI